VATEERRQVGIHGAARKYDGNDRAFALKVLSDQGLDLLRLRRADSFRAIDNRRRFYPSDYVLYDSVPAQARPQARFIQPGKNSAFFEVFHDRPRGLLIFVVVADKDIKVMRIELPLEGGVAAIDLDLGSVSSLSIEFGEEKLISA